MIRMKTTMQEVADMCERIKRIYEDSIVEEFMDWARQDDMYLRNNNGFNDHTGNLRSSLGAAVFKDAKMVFSTPFNTVMKGSVGSAEGRRAVEQVAEQTRGRIVKIMVAGMDYAQKVEDIESKDVLESRKIQCEREAQGIIERAMRKAEQRIRSL